MRQHKIRTASLVLVVALVSCGFFCNGSTAAQKLATASDAIAHSLANAQTAAGQAKTAGVMSQPDYDAFNTYLVSVSTAGQQLDAAIRANETAPNIAQKVNSFLNAFNQLQQTGLVGIKDKNTQLAISTIITGAESSIAIIVSVVGTGGK